MKLLGLDNERMEEVNKRFLALEKDLKGVGAIAFANFEFIEDNDSKLVAQDKRGHYVFFTEVHLKLLAYEDSAIQDVAKALRQTADDLEEHVAEKEAEAVAG